MRRNGRGGRGSEQPRERLHDRIQTVPASGCAKVVDGLGYLSSAMPVLTCSCRLVSADAFHPKVRNTSNSTSPADQAGEVLEVPVPYDELHHLLPSKPAATRQEFGPVDLTAGIAVIDAVEEGCPAVGSHSLPSDRWIQQPGSTSRKTGLKTRTKAAAATATTTRTPTITANIPAVPHPLKPIIARSLSSFASSPSALIPVCPGRV